MTLELWIGAGSLFATAVGGLVAFGRWNAGHAVRHTKAEGRLDGLDEDVEELRAADAAGDEVHKEITRDLSDLKIGLHELLVHEGIRTPGQGLDGN